MSEYAYATFALPSCRGPAVPVVGKGVCNPKFMESVMMSHSINFNTIEPPQSILVLKGEVSLGAPDNVGLNRSMCHNFGPNALLEMKQGAKWPGFVETEAFSSVSVACPTSGEYIQKKRFVNTSTNVEVFTNVNCEGDHIVIENPDRYLDALQTFAGKYSTQYNAIKLFKSFKPRYNTTVYVSNPYNVRVESESCYNISLPDLSNVGIVGDRTWNVSIVARQPENFLENSAQKITGIWFLLMLILPVVL